MSYTLYASGIYASGSPYLSISATISDNFQTISGTVNDVRITGLTNYNNASNVLYKNEDYYYNGGTFVVTGEFDTLDTQGISFQAGDYNYNIANPAFPFQSEDGSSFNILTTDSPADLPKSVNVTIYKLYSVICFVSGTLIRLLSGNRSVEELRAGDVVTTVSGCERRITWIGHRVIDCGAAAVPHEVHPVRIRAGAFGGGLPERDLFLSPGHPVLVGEGADEVLVPIMCLVNGTSIARMPVDTVTYWHVELDQHDILLAEGLPAESFLDYGNRGWFENGADHALTNPDFIPPGLNGRCRPVAVDGPLVEAERHRLDTLFHASLTAHCAWPAQEGWLAA